MSALTEFTIPADAVALEQAFHRAPELRVELTRTVACDDELSFLWSSGVPASTATEALAADTAVESVSHLSDDGEATRALCTVEWNEGPEPLIESLATEGGVLEAAASQGRWHVTTIHPDHESVTAAYKSCEVPIEVRSVRSLSDTRTNGTLTESQYEALSSALAHDFYDIPRDVTLTDLANDLGVSHQAVSERLRRSHRKLALDAVSEAGHTERAKED